VQKDVAHRVSELIAGVIATDGEIHPSEAKFLRRILVALRQDIDPVAELEPTLKGPAAAEALKDLPEDVRYEAFELLLAAAIVDGKVVPAEQRFLEAVADALGMGHDELEERISDRLLNG
jgi:uncharacterized tellurite resistance protein B-like protein